MILTPEFVNEAITEKLRAQKALKPDENVEITFEIPGGGDWSHCPVEADTFDEIRAKIFKV